MGRISLNDNIITGVLKMSDGHPGATEVLSKIIQSPKAFEPEEPIFMISHLDALGIYESDIYNLGQYVCEGQNMELLNQIWKNYSYGKLTREVLMDHIRNKEQFEVLYTIEDLVEDLDDKGGFGLPVLELERHDRLVSEGKYQTSGTPVSPSQGFFNKREESLRDTYSGMPTEMFVKILETRGFICGCKKKIQVEHYLAESRYIDATWCVYYHPDTAAIVSVAVAPEVDLAYFANTMTVQCRSSKARINLVGGNSSSVNKESLLLSKDIRESLFAWYDSILKQATIHEWATNKRYLTSDMYLVDPREKYYYYEYDEITGIQTGGASKVHSLFSYICTLANMELFDEGLIKILHKVKDDLGEIISHEINTIVNFESGGNYVEKSLEFILSKLGKDERWLEENGVDLEKAMWIGKDYNFDFKLKEPISISEYDIATHDVYSELENRFDCRLSNRNGRLFFYKQQMPRSATPDTKFINELSFNGIKICTDMTDDQVKEVLCEFLNDKGIKFKLKNDHKGITGFFNW